MLRKKILQQILLIYVLTILSVFVSPLTTQAAPLVPIEDAVDMIGQYVDPGADPLVLDYTRLNPNSWRLGPIGVNTPYGLAIDEVDRRLFAADSGNNRILVFNLDDNLRPLNAIADYVLGQPDFVTRTAVTSASGLSTPTGLAYASTTQLLFVADNVGNRVLVYDVSSITNGESAVNVLGQTDFTTNTAGLSSSVMNGPTSVSVDTVNNRLFVGEDDNARVLVFDVSTITNGESAVNVLGQPDFITNVASTTATGLRNVYSLQYEYERQYLYVANGARVSVFDVTNITDTEPALGVLTQTSFTVNSTTCCTIPAQATDNIAGITFDSTRKYLFVNHNRRLTIFDTTNITTPGTYVDILGVPIWSSGVSSAFVVGSTTVKFAQIGIGGSVFASTTLYVSDSGYNRILLFDVASITTGEPAVSVIGQNNDLTNGDMSSHNLFSDTVNNGVASASTIAAVNSSNRMMASVLDTTNDRLFVSDPLNNRVLVFNLDSSHRLIDREADYVLGQLSFASSSSATGQARLNNPNGLAFDPINNRLFVSDYSNNRILVFDTAVIDNGEPAINVLGNPGFNSTSGATSQAGIRSPGALAYSTTTGYLYVVNSVARIIHVYNTSDGIVNGENAISVIGNTVFSTGSGAVTQSTFDDVPMSLAIDDARQKLFVADSYRVLVFDAATTTYGRSAENVLGQPNFTTMNFTVDHRRSAPYFLGMTYTNNRLIGSRFNGIRIFDVEQIENNEPAIAQAGKETFETQSMLSSSVASSSSVIFGALAYDEDNELLYIGQVAYSRLAIFNAGPDTTAPVLSSASTSPDGTVVYIQYNEFLEDVTVEAPTSTDYIVNVGGTAHTPTSVTISSTTVALAIPTTIYQGNTVTVSYVAGANRIMDYSGNESANLTNQSVTNNSTVTDPNAPAPSPSPVVSSGGGGGGGGGSRISTPLPTVVSSVLPPASANAVIFTRDLTLTAQGTDVYALQRFLNARGHTVANTGAGSPGNETSIFGSLTRLALARFQTSVGITPATGYFGPLTRAFINKLGATPPKPPTAQTTPTVSSPTTITTPTTYTRDLTLESTGSDVTALQTYLIQQGYLQSGYATGYFGVLTQSALIKFQQANNITPALGYFGPKTRGVVEGR